MANKEEFKNFVKENPRLSNFVRSGEMTWQKFYEMYDLYGKDTEVWKDYLIKPESQTGEKAAAAATGAFGLTDLVGMFKNIDLDSIQNSVSSIQRVLGVFQDFSKPETPVKESYKPRPIYKHFED